MNLHGLKSGIRNRQRTLAILACLALLYLAAGVAFLHQHTSGPETPCHVCQAVHAPVSAGRSLYDNISRLPMPRFITTYLVPRTDVAHPASRKL
jgi:hypothetical protein